MVTPFPYAFRIRPVYRKICDLWGLNSLCSFRHLLLGRFCTSKEVFSTATFKLTCSRMLSLLLSYTAISPGGAGVLLQYGWGVNFICEKLFTSFLMLSFCRFDRSIGKRLTCRNRADTIYNHSCLRSHHGMFPPRSLTFLSSQGCKKNMIAFK